MGEGMLKLGGCEAAAVEIIVILGRDRGWTCSGCWNDSRRKVKGVVGAVVVKDDGVDDGK